MLDHVSLFVNNLEEAMEFYDSLLAELGIKRYMTFDHTAGYGTEHSKFFWITTIGNPPPVQERKSLGYHVAFHAPTRNSVQNWHKAAIELGAQDNGEPDIRSKYHPNYYAAYIIDIYGWSLEAVCHHPLESETPLQLDGIAS